jgi:hypothetical protein
MVCDGMCRSESEVKRMKIRAKRENLLMSARGTNRKTRSRFLAMTTDKKFVVVACRCLGNAGKAGNLSILLARR